MTLPGNRRLEELFNTVPVTDSTDRLDCGNGIHSDLPVAPETLAALDKIESALPAVRGLEASDSEMDDLAAKASESFDDLMSLGMQVDSRYASEIFTVAGTMLGHAITAKTAKINKKLRIIDLQLKKARLDQTQDAGSDTTGEGRVLNRNDLLRAVLAQVPETPIPDK